MSLFGINLINLIAEALLVVIVIFFATRNIILVNKIKKIASQVIQSEADKELLVRQVADLYKTIDEFELQRTEGFVNFISQSRDWAFTYIETVQESLVEFDNEISSILNYNEKYGDLAGDTLQHKDMMRISLAYQKLKELLPKNNENPDNLEQGENK